MMKNKVTETVGGDTFLLEGRKGLVRVRGLDAPEKGERGYESAVDKLKKLILDQKVVLKNQLVGHSGHTIADVYLNGRDIKMRL